ncbi:MAG: GNAT family N-acetyltransferase [Candidatus Pacearchaeota archaeon]
MPQLKKATKKGTKEIAKIYATEFSKPPYNENWDYESANNKIKLFSKYCDIWKVVEDGSNGQIIGFAIVNVRFWLPGTVAFLEQFAIKHEYQNKEVEKEILQHLIEIYLKRGFEKFMSISHKDSKTFKLYKDLGVEESKDNALMEKYLR